MDRKDYIGSSDAKRIMSGDWYNLRDEKLGVKAPDDLSGRFDVQLGKHVEPFHLQWLIDHQGMDLSTHAGTPGEQHVSPIKRIYGFSIRSTIDALEGPHDIPVEVKHSCAFNNQYEKAVDYYLPQLTHHMICWGRTEIWFSVVFGNSEPDCRIIGINREYEEVYKLAVETFIRFMGGEDVVIPAWVDVPQIIKDDTPINEMIRQELPMTNALRALIEDFKISNPHVKTLKATKEGLREYLPAYCSEVYTDELSIKRNRNGAVVIRVK